MHTTLATVPIGKSELVITARISVVAVVVALATMPLTRLRRIRRYSNYSFTRIADDTGPLGEIGISPVAINDTGQVAFLANLNTGEPVLLVGSGGALMTVADAAGRFRLLGFATAADFQKSTHGFPSINGLGQVTFRRHSEPLAVPEFSQASTARSPSSTTPSGSLTTAILFPAARER